MNITNTKEITWSDYPTGTNGLKRQHWSGQYLYDGLTVPLDLFLITYAGDNEHPAYYSIDIYQGSDKIYGDDYDSIEDALDRTNQVIQDNIEEGYLIEVI
jgi:hypothetical protein